ncbi:MAG: hypothetical protein ACK500_05375 [Flavobacteriales bacterium]|jgi:hypothetical protein
MVTRKLLFLFSAGMLFTDFLYGQCAMCRATAESASEHVDKGIGEGLNAGIIYLMGIPYVLLAAGVCVFFRKKLASLFRG